MKVLLDTQALIGALDGDERLSNRRGRAWKMAAINS